MPRDPQTGQFVSQEVYDAIVAEEGQPNPQLIRTTNCRRSVTWNDLGRHR